MLADQRCNTIAYQDNGFSKRISYSDIAHGRGSVKAYLIFREVLPFYFSLLLLIAAALLLDAALHFLGIVWIGRYLGIPGVLLILSSFTYSLRKRKLIKHGNLVALLRRHERIAWAGALLVLVHAGIHFNAALAWLAALAMMINIMSGLTGKYLLQRTQRWIREARSDLQRQGLPEAEIEDRLYWDSLTFGLVKNWRKVHVPITSAFGVLALAHIISTFLFWGWK